MEALIGLAAYIGRNRGSFRNQLVGLLIRVREGAATVIFCDSEIILVSNGLSINAMADRHLISEIVGNLICRIIGALFKGISGMRYQAFTGDFRTFGGLSITHQMVVYNILVFYRF